MPGKLGNISPVCARKTAVSYARYSSSVQRDVSIEQQLQDIRAFAKREGYTIIKEYADHAKSGFKRVKNRDAFQRMMTDAEKGSFDTVIAWKVDRFGRSREDSAIYKGRLRRHGVSVVYAMEPIPEGAAGVLLEGMLEATAEWYSRNLSENVTRGMHDNASKCLFNGTKIVGYCRGNDGRYALDPVEAPIVRDVFAKFAAGSSAAAIARDLQASGITTARGYAWSSQAVLRVLKNERYAGVYMWGGHRTEGGMPAIVSHQEWEAVQDMIKVNRRIVHQDQADDFILTGKLFCGHCGAAMIGDSGTSKSGSRYHYYTCLNHKNHKSCDKKPLRKEETEERVISFLVDQVLTDEMIELLADKVVEEEKKRKAASVLPAMEKELASVNVQIKNVNRAIASGVWSDSTIVMLKDLEAQAADLAASISSQRAIEADFADRDMVVFLMNKMKKLDRNDPAQRSVLIDTFVNAIYVYDDHFRLFINTVEYAKQIPFSDLSSPPPCSDDVTHGVLVEIHPNTAEFRIVI